MSTLKEPDLPMPMPLSQRLLAAAVVVAALYFGRELLIPLALATLLAFVLAPLNARIRRFGLPRAIAVTAVVAITLGALVGSSVFMAGQVRMLGKELPTYQNNIAEKFDRLRAQLRAPGVFTEASKVIDAVESEIAQTQGPFDGRSAAAARRPSRVELVPTPPGVNPPCSMADLIRIDASARMAMQRSPPKARNAPGLNSRESLILLDREKSDVKRQNRRTPSHGHARPYLPLWAEIEGSARA